MLLDLSGLTREERVMLQPSISNAREFDRGRSPYHPTSTFTTESQRRAKGKGKGKDGFKRADSSNTRWFGKGKHAGSGKSGASAHHSNLTSVEDYDRCYDEDMDESGKPCQAHNDPVDPRSDNGDEALD